MPQGSKKGSSIFDGSRPIPPVERKGNDAFQLPESAITPFEFVDPVFAEESEAADTARNILPPEFGFAGAKLIPRRMWGDGPGTGYCGECALQEALLYFGNYVSQERIRLACGREEFMVSEEMAEEVGEALHFAIEPFRASRKGGSDGEAFLEWARKQLQHSSPVIASWRVYTANPEDDEGDHIMPLTGVFTASAGKKEAVVGVEFHDLETSRVRAVTRMDGPDGSLLWKPADQRNVSGKGYRYALPADEPSGFAVVGNREKVGAAHRFVLELDRWDEPDWGTEGKEKTPPTSFRVSGFAAGLEPGERYALLRFDHPDDVPRKGGYLMSMQWSKALSFEAPAETIRIRHFDRLQSDGTYFYRLVEVPDGLDPESLPMYTDGTKNTCQEACAINCTIA